MKCKKNIEVVINGKMTYEKWSESSKRNIRLIDLTRDDLKQTDSIMVSCDTLEVISFSLSSGDCGVDNEFVSKSNKLTDGMKNIISKDCCKLIWIENIKVKGKSGNVYDILPFRVNLTIK